MSNKQSSLYFEWGGILQIIDSLVKHIDDLLVKKKIDTIGEIFRIIKN